MRSVKEPKPAVEITYAALIAKYVFLVAYALTSGVVVLIPSSGAEISSVVVFSYLIALITLGLVALFGVLSIVGVFHTRKHPDRPHFELVASYAFFVFFVSYPIVIVARTIGDGDFTRLPFAFLAFALCVTPYSRAGQLVRMLPKKSTDLTS